MAALYSGSCPRLIGLLTSIGDSRDEAEDLSQEAYLKLLPKWSKATRAAARRQHPCWA